MRKLILSATALVTFFHAPAVGHLPEGAKCLRSRKACKKASHWIHHFWKRDSNAHMMIDIGSCESGLDRSALSSGGHYGTFQFDRNARETYGYGWTYRAQARGAKAMWVARGTQPWSCA